MAKPSIHILILTLCVAVAIAELNVINAIQECQEEQGISDVQSIMMERSMTLKDENNEQGRCFIDCLMKKFAIYKNGVLDIDAVLEQGKEIIQYAKNKGVKVDENTIRTGVKDCSSKDGQGKCMKSYRIWKCLDDLAKSTLGEAI